MDNHGCVFLDVSSLPAPEPLQQALETLASMPRGVYLHLHNQRYPRLLYERLQARGFEEVTRMDTEGCCEVFIWHLNDAEAEQAARRAAVEYLEWSD